MELMTPFISNNRLFNLDLAYKAVFDPKWDSSMTDPDPEEPLIETRLAIHFQNGEVESLYGVTARTLWNSLKGLRGQSKTPFISGNVFLNLDLAYKIEFLPELEKDDEGFLAGGIATRVITRTVLLVHFQNGESETFFNGEARAIWDGLQALRDSRDAAG